MRKVTDLPSTHVFFAENSFDLLQIRCVYNSYIVSNPTKSMKSSFHFIMPTETIFKVKQVAVQCDYCI